MATHPRSGPTLPANPSTTTTRARRTTRHTAHGARRTAHGARRTALQDKVGGPKKEEAKINPAFKDDEFLLVKVRGERARGEG